MLRRILPAANAIFLGHVIARLGSLILVPLFLRYWSATRYGEYVALFAAASYLASLDIGIQQATVNRLRCQSSWWSTSAPETTRTNIVRFSTQP